jgi:cytochrome c553
LFGETRKDEKVTPVAAHFADDDIRGLGAYFASLPGPPAPRTPIRIPL